MKMASVGWTFAAAAAVLLSGCGPERVGQVVTGTVTFQGKPLDQGSIQFQPAEGQSTFSGSSIDNGNYRLPPEFGLAPGKYTVRINSSEGSVPTNSTDVEVGVFTERIPAKYNSESTLSAEVKEGEDNKFDFEIP
jgi:hypothetical protein